MTLTLYVAAGRGADTGKHGERYYVEPYGGGASVLLRKRRATQEVYNDLDEEIVNVFRVLREPGSAARLKSLLELTPFARAEYDLSYVASDDPVERARRTLVRAFMGFGSEAVTSPYKAGFRSKRAQSTLPSSEWSRYPDSIAAFVRRLRSVTVECKPALDILRRYDNTGTLFYLDPPYSRGSRTTHGDCYRHEMTDADHEELAEALRGLSGMIVLSGYATPLYDRLYADWTMKVRETKTAANSTRQECLWLSPSVEKSLNRLPLTLLLGIGVNTQICKQIRPARKTE